MRRSLGHRRRPQPPCSAPGSRLPCCGSPKQGLLFPSLPQSWGLPRSQIGPRGLPPGEVLGDGTHPGPPESACLTLAAPSPSAPGQKRLAGRVHCLTRSNQRVRTQHVLNGSRRTWTLYRAGHRLHGQRGCVWDGLTGTRGSGAGAGEQEEGRVGEAAPGCTRPLFGARWAVYGSSVLLTTSSQLLRTPGSALGPHPRHTQRPLPGSTANHAETCPWPNGRRCHKHTEQTACGARGLGLAASWACGQAAPEPAPGAEAGPACRTLGVTAWRSTDRPAP